MKNLAALATASLLILVSLASSRTGNVTWLKGTFHQHATQPLKHCLYAAEDVDACGTGSCLHKQDDGGTDADVLLDAIERSGRGYDFVGLAGNEVPPATPQKEHNLTWLLVTENQMAAMCAPDPESKHCKNPCNPRYGSTIGMVLCTMVTLKPFHATFVKSN